MFTTREQTAIAKMRALQTILPIYLVMPNGITITPR